MICAIMVPSKYDGEYHEDDENRNPLRQMLGI